ncbi:hypothetical protein ALT1644_280003 [Alteromonas macleodii]
MHPSGNRYAVHVDRYSYKNIGTTPPQGLLKRTINESKTCIR